MPDSYTHVRTALQALLRAGQPVASLPCYIAGANGPDPFYMYQFWRRKRRPDLAALASRIHREKTGQFLNTMLELAITPEQQSYAMGYLTHYTTDCTLHPYIAAMGDKGIYKGKREHARFETSIDSELFYKDYRTRTVPLYAATPMLLTDDLAQVTSLLHDTVLSTYEVDIPVVNWSDAYHDNLRMRKYMTPPRGGHRGRAKFFGPMRTNKADVLAVVDRMQPGRPLPHLPEEWRNPYTGEEMRLSFDEIITLAEQTGAACIAAAMRFWLGEMDEQRLAMILGDNNYYTGRPNPPPGQSARVPVATGSSAERPVPTASPAPAAPQAAPMAGAAPMAETAPLPPVPQAATPYSATFPAPQPPEARQPFGAPPSSTPHPPTGERGPVE